MAFLALIVWPSLSPKNTNLEKAEQMFQLLCIVPILVCHLQLRHYPKFCVNLLSGVE